MAVRERALGLGERILGGFADFLAEILRRAGERGFEFFVPAPLGGGRIGLRGFNGLRANALGRFLEIFLPLVELLLRGFGRGENAERWIGGLALCDDALDGFFDGVLQIVRGGLFSGLLSGLLGGGADGLFDGLADLGVEIFGVYLGRFARFFD